MGNAYADLTTLKTALGLTATTYDTLLLGYLEDASREIDNACGRTFYITPATRYFDCRASGITTLDDCLSISALTADSELDGTFDGETWTQGETGDYVLWPDNVWPKRGIRPAKEPDYSFVTAAHYLKITGEWGYGNGESASPVALAGCTGLVATADGTTLTLGTSGVMAPGQTVLLGSEQMFISAVTTGASPTATVVRGVNGTTAATHTVAAALYIYQYPRPVVRMTLYLASLAYDALVLGDRRFASEQFGDYRYDLVNASTKETAVQNQMERVIGPFRRTYV